VFLLRQCWTFHLNALSEFWEPALRHYIDWWLDGKGLVKTDLHQRMEETGILEPINDVAEMEREIFDCAFRAIWFSLNRLALIPEGRDLLLTILIKGLAGVPGFDGKELWLQRRAALLLYEKDGIIPFLENLKQIRPLLLRYLDLKRGFLPEEMACILRHKKKIAPGEIRDDHFDFDAWLEGEGADE